MTSEVKKPPDGGGLEVTDPLSMAKAIDEGKGSTEKNSDGTVTGDESLGSHISVEEKKSESSEGSATGEKSPGSYASAAASAMTDPWGLDGKICPMRRYERIIEASKNDNNNVLNVKLEKQRSKEIIPFLTQADIESILFEELKIDIDAVEEVDVSSRYNHKEIVFKKDHDVLKYRRPPFMYKGHLVTVGSNSSSRNLTKITFRNVPRSVPDEELINFCFSFGQPEETRTVYYGKYLSGNFKGLYNGTRWLTMELKRRVPINFIWLEGPEDIESTRITVTLEAGGETQCGHCLRTGVEGCPGLGKAKVCRAKMVKRAEIGEYMKGLYEKYQYKTLKAKYFDSLNAEKENNQTGEEEEEVAEQNSSDRQPEEESSEPEEESSEKEEESSGQEELSRENERLKKELLSLNERVVSQEKREITLNSLRKTILKNLEESLAEPLFAESNMSMLVTQFSLSLKDEEYSINDKGLIILNDNLIFKGMNLDSEDEKEQEIIRSNFAAFKKAVTQHTLVKVSTNGERRLSINKRPRNPSDDDNGSESKKQNATQKASNIPAFTKTSRRNSQKTTSLTTHHQTK